MKTEAEILMLARAELTGIAKSPAPLVVKKQQAQRLGKDVSKRLQACGLDTPTANHLMTQVALQVRAEVGGT